MKKSKGGGQKGGNKTGEEGGGRREEGVPGLEGFKKALCPSQRAFILGLT